MAKLRVAAALGVLLAATTPGWGAAAQTGRVAPTSHEQMQLSFAPVVRQAAPAVVNVFTKKVVRQQGAALFNDPFFRQFFGDRLPFGLPQERVQNSLGSGVIVRGDGTIVTNHHVIKDADEIRVVLADRREFDAQVVRKDERTDLAVLKIDTGREVLPHLPLRDSDDLEVGDLVLAIGNPFGVGQTVTSGIVSALARTNAGITDYRFFIQTDAAINPGNSGGALITLDGKLAGVNTAIFSRSGGSIGIGFAIPANMVRTVIEAQPGQNGTVVRPWLGAGGQAVSADIAASIGLRRPVGVLVNEIYPGGPAEKAGLRIGDVISHIDGKEVDDGEALRFRVATGRLGGTARLTVLRRGEELSLSVALQAPPETPARDTTTLTGNHPMVGAVVANLSPALAEEIGFDGPARGVVVTEIKGGPASRLGLKPGDVVAKINDQDVTSVKSLTGLLSRSGNAWRITIRRDGKLVSVTVGR